MSVNTNDKNPVSDQVKDDGDGDGEKPSSSPISSSSNSSNSDTDSSFQNYKEIRDACLKFADRANQIEHRANTATQGVKNMMLLQVQLARSTDEVLDHIHQLAEHYKRMDKLGDELLLPANYVLLDRMMDADVEGHYLRMTTDFLADAKKGLDKANLLVQAHEYMEMRRQQVHETVDEIKQLLAATSTLAREVDAFVPLMETFFHNLDCGCDENEGCVQHEWEPKSKIDRSVTRLDEKTTAIHTSLNALLQRLASDVGKHPASTRAADEGASPLAGVLQANIDQCVIGSCSVCRKEDHTTACCPQARMEQGALRPDEEDQYLMSGGLQSEGDEEVCTSGFL